MAMTIRVLYQLVLLTLVLTALIVSGIYFHAWWTEHFTPHIADAVKHMSFREAVFSKYFDLWLFYRLGAYFVPTALTLLAMVSLMLYAYLDGKPRLFFSLLTVLVTWPILFLFVN
jgi:hypothetical protein